MSLETKLVSLAQAVGADVKLLTDRQGSLTALSTTDKTSLVGAINEIFSALGSSGAQIDDNAGDGAVLVTWSANRIYDAIEAAKAAVKNELTNGASAALDTLAEFEAAIGNDPNFAATISTQIANRVRFDSAQTLTAAQQLQACTNIGVGNPDVDLANAYTSARDSV
jgi:hypothetical protein